MPAIDIRDRQDSIHHTTDTLTSDETRSECESVHVEGGRRPAFPNVVARCTDDHRKGVVHLGNDKGETDGVPVGDPVPAGVNVSFALAYPSQGTYYFRGM